MNRRTFLKGAVLAIGTIPFLGVSYELTTTARSTRAKVEWEFANFERLYGVSPSGTFEERRAALLRAIVGKPGWRPS